MSQNLKTTSTLSDENYYSNEADWQYMSTSQYKSFLKCEAAALAKLKGDWAPTSDPKALLVGNYVHSYFESKEVHEAFKEENKSKMFSSRKPHGLLKDFQIAEQMIERLKQEEVFMNIYQGEKETIVTGELFGTTWKGKIDCLNVEDEYFVDIKTTKDMHERKWNENYGSRETFIVNFGYVLQMAIYQELLLQQHGKMFMPIIAAVSKQTPSEAKLITIDQDKMSYELIMLKENIERIVKVKNGEERPIPCGTCEYCRGNLSITGFTSMDDL
ncbi:PD-(D/E)XK nuclease-like domain-containing protein [Enterococcus durans]|uniref:PD-(D/E)XK nuclease-like domain-containing protein n=2 Tax=Enterococcus durans TaxID=53345 RepID=UPI0022E8A7DD|nr:PD-(D/E)XK nuclease-like domain-containing protein [Enterococcus durans]